LEATDADLLPDHTSTVYRIVDGDPQGNFSVNATTGLISVAAPLDCEAIPASWNATFRLTVMAVDMEQRALYDTTTVAVHVHVILSLCLYISLMSQFSVLTDM